jgi:imidazolonepropionase-like amidohydrolase
VRTLFANGVVFDGTGAPAARGGVVIEGDRIVEVGQGNGDEMHADGRVDLAGAAVVPGFFDCHTHVTVSGFDYMSLLQRPFSFQFYEAVENLRRTLDLGITTIRDAHGADLGVQQAVERGLIPGPRMQSSRADSSRRRRHQGVHVGRCVISGATTRGTRISGTKNSRCWSRKPRRPAAS